LWHTQLLETALFPLSWALQWKRGVTCSDIDLELHSKKTQRIWRRPKTFQMSSRCFTESSEDQRRPTALENLYDPLPGLDSEICGCSSTRRYFSWRGILLRSTETSDPYTVILLSNVAFPFGGMTLETIGKVIGWKKIGLCEGQSKSAGPTNPKWPLSFTVSVVEEAGS